MSRRTAALLVAAVAAGALLRLLWLGDMEYKIDEADMFARAQEGHLPGTGIESSAGLDNPGMSVWAFVFLAKGFGITGPVGLARAVAILAVLAVAGLALFAAFVVDEREREPWLWAVGLVAVNPVGVIFTRKIWTLSLFPILTLGMLAGWWKRDRWWGAFAWGLVGAWLGQIHMSGFFLAGGFALWTALFRRRGVKWLWWFAGSVLGALTLIPWIHYVLTSGDSATRSVRSIVLLDFWRAWIAGPSLGVDLRFSLGSSFKDFLEAPHLGSTPTFLVGLAFLACIALGVAIAVVAARTLWPRRDELRSWPAVKRVIGGGSTNTGLAVAAALLGFGLLITFNFTVVYRHYLVVAFALPAVALACAALLAGDVGRRLLSGLVVAQAVLAFGFLAFIHDHGGAPGDYGIAYDHQTAANRPVKPAP